MAEKILEKPLSDKIKTDNSKKKIKNTDKAIISTENSVEETPPQPAPPAPAPARGNLSIFKLVFYYWIISQVIGFFFKSSPTGPQPGLYSNIFLMDEPLVN